ncbi:hypothetical protein GYN07_09410 [Rhizobium leguminosarum bv. viciae 248]|uniref:hypothetical protein n=1 Tax=Rhizobium leguminosarum TaxID=384 RepID=UPI0003A40EE2|nr:hypothetical protein [Rhizobium leguminosarum]MCA2412288.1 hypothetical protein [Rhizobium leguminosarum]NKM64810.1 hypothetical protein [Rhizobium leguminosarum bv. viciae]QHW24531.1 hypothetical protein GYN07_09410 [Rhizobium leguminosarum bv. viciae 248]
MHFLEVFAIASLIAAGIFHVCMLFAFEHLTSKINKYGPNLVTKRGRALPEIDLHSQLVPTELKNKFLLYRQAWIIVITILMIPLVAYLISKAFS